MAATNSSSSFGESVSLISTGVKQQSEFQGAYIRNTGDKYYEDILGAQAAARAEGVGGTGAAGDATLRRTLGSGEFYKAAFNPFAWGEYFDKISGAERIRKTKEMLKEESDRLAADELAKRRRKNIAAGIMLMQQKGMINFFR